VLFLPRAVKGRRSTVAALRCGNCGHMLLFAQSPETIKRKNRPADEAGF
jgi:hypothetical protein